MGQAIRTFAAVADNQSFIHPRSHMVESSSYSGTPTSVLSHTHTHTRSGTHTDTQNTEQVN